MSRQDYGEHSGYPPLREVNPLNHFWNFIIKQVNIDGGGHDNLKTTIPKGDIHLIR